MINRNVLTAMDVSCRKRRMLTIILAIIVAPLASGAIAAGQCVVQDPVVVGTTLPNEISSLSSTLVFSENFDLASDWIVPKNGQCENGTEDDCEFLPASFTHMYTAEKWHPSQSENPNSHPSGAISSEQYRGVSGKSYITFDESWGSPGDWGSDATIAKRLDGAYRDIYAEYWIHFQPGFRWTAVDRGQGLDTAKLARFTSFGGPDNASVFSFLSGGLNTPIALGDLEVIIGGSGLELTLARAVIRCSPVNSNYKCGSYDDEPWERIGGGGEGAPFVETLGDGTWHKMGLRAKQNSAPGVKDGIMQMWVDNVLYLQRADVPFIGTGGTMETGFNMFMIGGNMHNNPEDESAKFEQWTAFDDIKVFSLAP